MKILFLIAVSLFGNALYAQQISPLYVEAKMKLKSQFSVTNLGVQPLPVSVEAREMILVDGKPTLVMPTAGTHVELEDTSGVVAPKSARTFDYKVSCDHDCLIVIMAGMVGPHAKQPGVVVKLWFPSSVYACTDSAKDCRVRVKKQLGMD